MAVLSYTHVGITVTDLDVSRRFFTEALGFKPVVTSDGGSHKIVANDEYGKLVSRLLELDEDFDADVEFLQRDGQTIELVHYKTPSPQRLGRRTMAACGLSHMCFLVDDIDATVAEIKAHGGSLLEDTRIETSLPDGVNRQYVLCLDPDEAVRVELIVAAHLPNA